MRKISLFLIIITLSVGAFWGSRFLVDKFETEVPKIKEEIKKSVHESIKNKVKQVVSEIKEVLPEVKEEISAPPPLVAKKLAAPKSSSPLNKTGVFAWTNVQRVLSGNLPLLLPNSLLEQVAALKVQDMFEKQYFEHVSPTGEGASEVAKKVGYEFIAIGENLALGNFETDQKLVEAWMNSPGHRANILNLKYQEIGVAVEEGIYEGQRTWLAVQIFGKPLAACPKIDMSLKTQIEVNKIRLDEMESSAKTMRDDLESSDPKTREEVNAHNQKVERYNQFIGQINSLITKTKSLVSEYNGQVQSFNTCLAA